MNNEEKNFQKTNINWYPGHMAKTKKDLIESLKLIDIVIEILDARIPKSSKNPELEQYTKTKKKIIVLNKSDLADENVTKRWVEYYQSKDIVAIPVEANTGKGMKNIIAEIKKEAKEIIDKQTKFILDYADEKGYNRFVMVSYGDDDGEFFSCLEHRIVPDLSNTIEIYSHH
jgi:ribosome biogenesis GTPase A